MKPKECRSCVKEPTGRINVARFVDKLDECFARNDINAAKECIAFWQNEADKLGDRRGLLSVLNEAVGLYRKCRDEENAMKCIEKAIDLIYENGLNDSISGATVFINVATALSSFDKFEKALEYYYIADEIYIKQCKTETYEYAALINNQASALNGIKKYDESEKCYLRAIDILKKDGKHDGEIAVSLINLAHLRYDRDSNDIENVENTIDAAWEYINSPNQPHDANYAFILSKLAPSFEYFQRPEQAQALKEVSDEIYERN